VADDRDQTELALADIEHLIGKTGDPMGLSAVRFVRAELVRLRGIKQRACEVRDRDVWVGEAKTAHYILTGAER
jgi:hypothetical protein